MNAGYLPRAMVVARGRSKIWDCVVVGGGPAGLSAAIYMGRFTRQTLVIDDAKGRWAYGQRNDNYLGFPRGISALRLHALGRAQAERFGVEFLAGTVRRLRLQSGLWSLETSRGFRCARTVIWAAGVVDIWPDAEGVRPLIGKRLFWCIVCDGWRTRDKEVVLFGRDASAARTTLQFLTYTSKLTLVMEPGCPDIPIAVRRRLLAEGIRVLEGRPERVWKRRGPAHRVRVRLADGRRLEADYLFSLLGNRPRTGILEHLPVSLAGNGHVRIDDKNRTSHPQFFAAGDVSDKHSHQVVSAAHEGAMAAQAANQVLYPRRQRLEPADLKTASTLDPSSRRRKAPRRARPST